MAAETKADIANYLHEKIGFDKISSKELVQLFFETIIESLEAHKDVKISGFGNFVVKSKKERPGRNPKTGEEIPIKPRRVVTFKPGKKLRAKVEFYAREQ